MAKLGRPVRGWTRKQVSVKVTEDQYRRLHAYCKATGRGTSLVVQALIEEHLPK